MTMSLLDQSPISMSITADTESERKHLPAANSLNNKLLLADAGYISREYFADDDQSQRKLSGQRSQNLPKVQAAYRQDGREMPKLLGKSSRISIGEAAEPRFWIWM